MRERGTVEVCTDTPARAARAAAARAAAMHARALTRLDVLSQWPGNG